MTGSFVAMADVCIIWVAVMIAFMLNASSEHGVYAALAMFLIGFSVLLAGMALGIA